MMQWVSIEIFLWNTLEMFKVVETFLKAVWGSVIRFKLRQKSLNTLFRSYAILISNDRKNIQKKTNGVIEVSTERGF